jgi:hypothetical protein
MADISHLTFEQRRTWERLDQFAYGWEEGRAAAIRGATPKECPYQWQPGDNTPRLRWFEGFVMAHDAGAAPEATRKAAYREYRREQLHAHSPTSAVRLARWLFG